MDECSYCDREALYIGDGQDGDSYCELHTDYAPGGYHPIED